MEKHCQTTKKIPLDGEWNLWLAAKEAAFGSPAGGIHLPGSVTEQGYGTKNDAAKLLYLSEKYQYLGKATFMSSFLLPERENRRVVFVMERSRATRVWVNGLSAGSRDQLTTAQRYDITELVRPGENALTVEVDNTFENLPRAAILGSHMATEHTQTNWNGVLGEIALEIMPLLGCDNVSVYPDVAGRRLRVRLEFCQQAADELPVVLRLTAAGQNAPLTQTVTLARGRRVLEVEYPLQTLPPLWSEFDPQLTSLQVSLKSEAAEWEKTVVYGMRTFAVAADHHHFAVNGKAIFVRSEANCAVFPQTGYAPMEEAAWEKLLSTYKRYGVNYVRFHSWCPPEAAFAVADRLGLYLQPELCEWTFHTFEEDSEYDFYSREAHAIADAYANHPSYVAMTWGNELRSARRDRMSELCRTMRAYDPTRLYAEGSNAWYGEEGVNPNSDFVLAQSNYASKWRGAYAGNHGFINDDPPAETVDYSDGLKAIDKPVISFEVGQFQVYPDYGEIEEYQGPLEPRNLMAYRENLAEHGMAGRDKAFHRDSGRLAMLCYREEIEAAMRTPEMGGISLLGLQDFSGQGTALVGMMNALGEPKTCVSPEEFHRFFSSVVPLLRVDKRVLLAGEAINMEVLIHNFGDKALTEPVCCRVVERETGRELFARVWNPERIPQGQLTSIAKFQMVMPQAVRPLEAEVQLSVGVFENHYSLYGYPQANLNEAEKACIVTAADAELEKRLAAGESLLLLPPVTPATLPASYQSAYMSDFWCWVMFSKWDQHGTMGLSLDPAHPLFQAFPTDTHTNPRWWAPLHGSRAMVLTGSEITPVIQMADNLQRNEKLALAYEVRVGKGALLVCSMDLPAMQAQPSAAWLLKTMAAYVAEGRMKPKAQVSFDFVKTCVKGERKNLLLDEKGHPAVQPKACINQQTAALPLRGVDGYWDTVGLPDGVEPYYELHFDAPVTVDTVQLGFLLNDVYDGNVGHDLPGRVEAFWDKDGGWQPVQLRFASAVTQGEDNVVYFAPVTTQKLKLVFAAKQEEGVEIAAISLFANQPVAVTSLRVYGE